MPQTTPHLALPLIAAGQAQKHVPHNEALLDLDALVQLACLDKDLTTPPPNPAEGDRYLVAAADPGGAWAGLSGQIACYRDGVWTGFPPRPGWLAWMIDEADLYLYTGTAWIGFRTTLTTLQDLARLGIGTAADAANPFAAKLNAALWTARTSAEGGTGDLRYTLNKQASGNTLSVLFQSGFSGRAEIGLTGDDDLRVKVSTNGATFREALRIDRASGRLDLKGPTPSAALATPALRLAQGLATDGSLIGGGLTMVADNGSMVWPLGGLAGTVGTQGASGGYPGGLALYVKPADGSSSTGLMEAARFGPNGNLGLGIAAASSTKLGVAGAIAHTSDNVWSFGTAALRASVVYAATGAISTSDAREKTPVVPLTAAELAAATALAREIGTFRFLSALEAKGPKARRHVGLTVQRCIAVMEAHGLDPLSLGLVCHDTWEAVPPTEAIAGREAETDAAGRVTAPAILPQAATPGRPGGDRYGFRTDELMLFLARGFDARLSALEAAA